MGERTVPVLRMDIYEADGAKMRNGSRDTGPPPHAVPSALEGKTSSSSKAVLLELRSLGQRRSLILKMQLGD